MKTVQVMVVVRDSKGNSYRLFSGTPQEVPHFMTLRQAAFNALPSAMEAAPLEPVNTSDRRHD